MTIFGFWLFGYAFSDNTTGFAVGEEQDYIFCMISVLNEKLQEAELQANIRT